MISHLSYVRCDGCGAVAGGTDDMGDTAREARRNAERLGWLRVPSSHGPGRDLCPTCAAKESR